MFMPKWLCTLQCCLFPYQSRNSRNARRRASAPRRVRLSLEGLEERLTPSTINPLNNDTPALAGQINPNAASPTTTTASDATATFKTGTQDVTLSATVTSTAGTVNEGKVTFTILKGTTVIGTATSQNVSSGKASVSYALPAGTAAGTYTIEANYTDSTGTSFASSSDNTHTLTVSAATTTTTASNATIAFSTSAQNVTLTATVTSGAGTVNEGSVQFTILEGTTVIGTATSKAVSNGSASVSYSLPAGTAAGTYTIKADYTDTTGNFNASSDTSHTLSVTSSTASPTTTAASNATATFSTGVSNVTLTATVTSSAGTVNEGKVTFTILKGTTVIGTATSQNVSNGQASVSYSLPAGTAAGTYTIEANYTDSTGKFAISSDTTHTLTVSAASTTTTAKDVTATFNSKAQTVTLTATVTSSAGTVKEGTVTFTLLDSVGNTVGTATSSSVNSSGQASVTYSLPAGTVAGTYTINASYSDASGNFASSSDTTHKLTINTASTTIKASNATASFSSSDQTVTLTATVTSSAGTVNEGTITFTLLDSLGNTIGTPTISGTVSNGTASVSYVLPGGTAVGSYTIDAVYIPGTNFSQSSTTANTLTVNAASSTSVTLTAVSITPNVAGMTADVTLTAQVSNPSGIVGEGIVTFTMAGVSAQGNLVNGMTIVTLTVPIQVVIGNPSVSLAYKDNAASPSFTNSSTSKTIYLNVWNGLLPSSLSFSGDGSELIQVQMSGQQLLGFAYSATGLPTQINIASVSLPVTYTNVSGNVLVTIDGLPWQLNFFNSAGQFQGLQSLAFSSSGSPEWLIYGPNGQVIGANPI
jgi:hypothetical protein